MAVNCGVPFGLCRVRATRVDSSGNVIAGNNMYVTDAAISMNLTVNKEAGNSVVVRNGCGCVIARRKFPDSFNWLEMSFVKATLDPVLEQFLLGGETIEDGADVVGFSAPERLECDEDDPAVALEFWTEHIVGSGQDGAFPWIHWVVPSTIWTLGDTTFEEGNAPITVDGTSRTNTNWGEGPYGDGPPDGTHINEWGYWKTDVDPPAADCAAQAVTSAS